VQWIRQGSCGHDSKIAICFIQDSFSALLNRRTYMFVYLTRRFAFENIQFTLVLHFLSTNQKAERIALSAVIPEVPTVEKRNNIEHILTGDKF
jgi:hypothetical protein